MNIGKKISVIENLGALEDQVDVIDLTDNEIQRLENFPRSQRLKWLLLSNNNIYRIGDNLHVNVPNLMVLVLSNNRISSLIEIDKLAGCTKLQVLNLSENPICLKEHFRLYAIHKVPSLTTLDFERVRLGERDAAKALFSADAGKILEKNVQDQGKALGEFSTGGSLLTVEQKLIFFKALERATTQEQIERIEKILKSGIAPDEELLAKIAREDRGDIEMESAPEGNNGEVISTTVTDANTMVMDDEAPPVTDSTPVAMNDDEVPTAGENDEPDQSNGRSSAAVVNAMSTEEDKPGNEEELSTWTGSLKVAQLKTQLKKRELNATGLKDVLRKRLLEYVIENGR